MKMQKLGVQFLVGMTILCSYATESTVRLQLTHIDAGRGFTCHDLLHHMVRRSKARATWLLSSNKVSALVIPGSGKYLARFSIGTPPQLVQLVVDMGNDLTETQCVPLLAMGRGSPEKKAIGN
jgi:hypothetical protein